MTTLTTRSGKTARALHGTLDYKLGAHRGAGRVWLEGHLVAQSGFRSGVRYTATTTETSVSLRLDAQGARKVSGHRGAPVLDIRAFSAALGTVERVHVRFEKAAITIGIHPLDAAAIARVRRLNDRLASGARLELGSVCHGGGVAANALLRGLGSSRLAFAQDISDEYLAQARQHNPSWDARTMIVQGDLGDVVTSELPTVDVLEAGLPCISASRAGRAKKGLAQAEDDAATADLIVAFCKVIDAVQPAVIVLENVPEYATSASASILRRYLARLGYTVQEMVIDGAAWSLEARQRWILVAATRGLDLALSLTPGERPAALGDVLDRKVPATAWKSTETQARKAARDKANGNGFSRGRRLLDAAATSVPTLRRGYIKGGSCDARLAHPTKPGLARLFSAAEHARIKGIPAGLVTGLSETAAHEVLGQSVIAPSFVALGAAIAASVRS